ncbi:SDR family oxidoreductase [Marinobacter sp. TBZ242]|uniref:SDR family oxidoreductase n=1 Tax=Marinobacter azerbaijanicus TaxID=3050455 RepID=A0ABT7IIM8_9GAMM|nr:SDR family oxidoreductase [Marinobacter sp. TBZ242]MDL0434035.1 SDR family oxidoreductase [Marinobacter sp. TBZ242]
MIATLIFGASRGTGFEIARCLRGRGHRVVALVRPTSDEAPLVSLGVECVIGDVLSTHDVRRAFRKIGEGGRVVSTLSGLAPDGGYTDELGNRRIIEVAHDYVPERVVLITSIGCGEMAPYRSPRAIEAFGCVVDAKTRAEEALRASGLPFSILRPGGLKSEPATGRGILSTDPAMHGFIHRADLAKLVAIVLDDPTTLGGVYAAVDRDEARCDNPIEPVMLEETDEGTLPR